MKANKSTSAGKWSVALVVIPVAIAFAYWLILMVSTRNVHGEAGLGVILAIAQFLYFGSHLLTLTSLIGLVVGIFAVFKSKWQRGTMGVLLNLSVLIVTGSYLTISYYKWAADPNRLLSAVKRGDSQTVDKLVAGAFDINYLYGQGTVLSYAVEHGQVEFVEYFLLHGADIHVDNSLEKAVRKGKPEIVRMLLDHDASNIDKTLDKIVKLNTKVDPKNVKMLLDYGANPNCLYTRHQDIAKLLLEYKADVNYKDQKGITPLHYAVKNSNIELMKLFLDWGANVNAQDEKGDTPLHTAIDYLLNKAGVELLINRKANANIQNKQGQTPLHRLLIQLHGDQSRQQSQIDFCELLLANGADAGIKEVGGRNPLELRKSVCPRSRDDSQFQMEILRLIQKYQNMPYNDN